MQHQVFGPPNSHKLSEDVIGNVLPRKWPIHQANNFENNNCELNIVTGREEERNESSQNSVAEESTSVVAKKTHNVIQRRPQTKVSLQYITAVTDQTTMDCLQQVLKANRAGRRRRQTKYQNKKKRELSELTDSIPLLREQIDQLQEKRDILSRKKQTPWSACIEYFQIFATGLRGSIKNAFDCCRGSIAPDVDTGTVVGLIHMIENWKRLTQLFPDIHTRLDSLTLIETNTVVAKTTTTFTMSEKSIRAAFPHLVHSSTIQSDRRVYIVSKLLDQRVEMRGSVRFDWDSRYNHVVRLHTQTDMLSPILQLVSNLENTSVVFGNALITPCGNLVVEDRPS